MVSKCHLKPPLTCPTFSDTLIEAHLARGLLLISKYCPEPLHGWQKSGQNSSFSHPPALAQGRGVDIPLVFPVKTEKSICSPRLPGRPVHSRAQAWQPWMSWPHRPLLCYWSSLLRQCPAETLTSVNIFIFPEGNGKWKMGFNYLEHTRAISLTNAILKSSSWKQAFEWGPGWDKKPITY